MLGLDFINGLLDTFRRVQIEASPQSNPGDFLGDIDKAVDCDESIRFPS
jgi:hypothetical protein